LAEALVDETEDHAVAVLEEDLTEDRLICMKLPVTNAAKTAKFHSNLLETNQYIAAIVLDKMRVQVQAGIILIQEAQVCKHNLEEHLPNKWNRLMLSWIRFF